MASRSNRGDQQSQEQGSSSDWVYAGGLPFELTEGDIICVFSQYGEINQITLARDRETGKSRGFAFINYEDPKSCQLAVDNLHETSIVGRRIKVSFANNYRPPKGKQPIDVAPREGDEARMPVVEAYKPRDQRNRSRERRDSSAIEDVLYRPKPYRDNYASNNSNSSYNSRGNNSYPDRQYYSRDGRREFDRRNNHYESNNYGQRTAAYERYSDRNRVSRNRETESDSLPVTFESSRDRSRPGRDRSRSPRSRSSSSSSGTSSSSSSSSSSSKGSSRSSSNDSRSSSSSEDRRKRHKKRKSKKSKKKSDSKHRRSDRHRKHKSKSSKKHSKRHHKKKKASSSDKMVESASAASIPHHL